MTNAVGTAPRMSSDVSDGLGLFDPFAEMASRFFSLMVDRGVPAGPRTTPRWLLAFFSIPLR